jgi:colanic acid biosynthesis glycosyl transferase WcaI
VARVLIHTLVFSPDGVSTAYLMSDLARQLKAAGHDVTVLTTTPHYNAEPLAIARQPITPVWGRLLGRSDFHGIPVYHVRMPPKGRKVLARAFDYLRFHLVSLLASIRTLGRFDIVIAPSPPLSMGVVGWLQAALHGAPAVYNVQEIFPDFLINQGLIRSRWQIGMLRVLERFVYRRNRMIVPISEWFARALRARGVPDAKLTVIPNFVDTELYHPLPRVNPFATAHGLADRFTILYGGNLGLSLDYESLLHAAAAVRHLPITFAIVGDGARREWLAGEIARRGLENITLLGYQPRDRMGEINASSDVGTIPMMHASTTDTFPSKIYTIMACAKPVIVSADADSELGWLVREAGCGQVVPPEDPQAYTDAVLRAYEQRAELPAQGERGRRFVENTYAKEVVGRAYSALVHRLVNGDAGRAP